jgi:hypothetical protein
MQFMHEIDSNEVLAAVCSGRVLSSRSRTVPEDNFPTLRVVSDVYRQSNRKGRASPGD